MRSAWILSVAVVTFGCASLWGLTGTPRVCDPYDLFQGMSHDQAAVKCGKPYSRDTLQVDEHRYEKWTWTSGERLRSYGPLVASPGEPAEPVTDASLAYPVYQHGTYYRRLPIELCVAWFKDGKLLAWHFLVDHQETHRSGDWDEIRTLGETVWRTRSQRPNTRGGR